MGNIRIHTGNEVKIKLKVRLEAGTLGTQGTGTPTQERKVRKKERKKERKRVGKTRQERKKKRTRTRKDENKKLGTEQKVYADRQSAHLITLPSTLAKLGIF